MLLNKALAQAELVAEQHMGLMKEHWWFHNLHYDILEQLVPRFDRLAKVLMRPKMGLKKSNNSN